MRNFTEKLKDFLYDATDYVLILVIIVGVAVIIGWRLDILFAKDMDKHDIDNDKTTITNIVDNDKDSHNDKEKDNIDDSTNNDIEDNNVDIDNNNNNNNIDTNDNEVDEGNNDSISDNDTIIDTNPNTEEIITLKIPSGSLPPTIANILLEKGLIDNKMDFLIKSQELKLDTKLKSGEFKIKKGTSLEELIKTLAK